MGFYVIDEAFDKNYYEDLTGMLRRDRNHPSIVIWIVGITSEAGSMGDNHRDANLDYSMAKAALNFACVVLQRRLGPKGMRVLSIHPRG